MTRFALGIVAVLAFGGFAAAGPADMFEEKEKDFGALSFREGLLLMVPGGGYGGSGVCGAGLFAV